MDKYIIVYERLHYNLTIDLITEDNWPCELLQWNLRNFVLTLRSQQLQSVTHAVMEAPRAATNPTIPKTISATM